MMEIEEIRKQIDLLDDRILRLIEERIGLAKKAKELKSDTISFSREQEIYSRLKSNDLTPGQIRDIFSEIISASRKAQQDLRVAFLGPEGSFTNIAAIKKFGKATSLIPLESFEDVFKTVLSQQADFCILPIENSIEGSVNGTLDLLQEIGSEIKIVAEVNLKIVQNLIAESNNFDRIYSHSHALAQCRQWIKTNYPVAMIVETASTAKAAEIAKKEGQAAIASAYAADKYGLKILHESIEDNNHNFTRFIVLGRTKSEHTDKNKTSLLFSVKHKSGALFDALEPFKKNSINLTRIESRPSRKTPFEYVFFVDIQGHPMQSGVKMALEEMHDKCTFVNILGTYPEDSN